MYVRTTKFFFLHPGQSGLDVNIQDVSGKNYPDILLDLAYSIHVFVIFLGQTLLARGSTLG